MSLNDVVAAKGSGMNQMMGAMKGSMGGQNSYGSNPFSQMVNQRQRQATTDMMMAARGMPMRPPLMPNALVDAAANLSQNMGLVPPQQLQDQMPQMPKPPPGMGGGPGGPGGMPGGGGPPPLPPGGPGQPIPPLPGTLAQQVQPPGTPMGMNAFPPPPSLPVNQGPAPYGGGLMSLGVV